MDDADYWLPELSEEAQARVKAMEETYNSTERGDIKSVFTVAIGIEELRTACYGEEYNGGNRDKEDRVSPGLRAIPHSLDEIPHDR